MASGFSVNALTVAGQSIFANAAAGDRIVYTRMLSGASAIDADDAPTATAADFTGPQGSIKSASASGNGARIVGFIGNQPSSSVVKSFALCGRLESQSADSVIIVLSDENAAFHVPSEAEPVGGVQIGFFAEITAAASVSVQVIGAGTASLSDLDRFVSLHKAGDATIGDDQTVRGLKTFTDGIDIGENGEVRSLFDRGAVVSSRGVASTDFAQLATLAADSTLDAMIGAEGVSGSESERPYTATVLARAPRNDADGASFVTAEANLDDTDGAKAYLDARVTVDSRLASFTLALNDDKNGGDGIVSISGGYDSDESDYLLQITAPRTKIAGPVEITDGIEGGLSVNGDLDLTGALNLTGSSINYTPDPLFPDIPLVISGTDVLPGSDNALMLGSSNFRWKAYLSSLQGLAPSASSGSAVVPIGCALFIDVGANYFSGATYEVGDEITITSRLDMPAMTCSVSGGQMVRGSLDLPVGAKFRLATSGNVAADEAGGEPNNIIFAVRVE